MSCAELRSDIGKSMLKNLLSSFHLEFICGVSADVAHVSITSFSATNLFDPHLHKRFGLSFKGLTGSCASSANKASPQFLQYQTGKGMPKYFCLEISQSHCNPFIQSS